MTIRSLFVCAALILFASFVYVAGSDHRTRDGQTLVWRDVPSRGDEATWSGKRDKDGFATGSGVLTWYKVRPAIVTGSNILDTRRYVNMINHYSGRMVRGKFKGAVTYLEADGRRLRATSGNETNRPSRRQKAAQVRTTKVRAAPTAEETPTPPSQQTVMQPQERTSASATPEPASEQSPSPSAEEPQTAEPAETDTLVAKQMATPPEPALEQSPSPSEPETAVPPQTDTLVAKQMATPPSEQQARRPDARNTTVPTPSRSDDSLRSASERPLDLPKPPRTMDAQTVARLDAVYQAAVKANDVA